MSEARITNFGFYLTHDDDKTVTITDDAFDLISKLIQHIPSKQFKTIKYYGTFATKKHKYRLCKNKLHKNWEIKKSSKLNKHRFLIILTFEYNAIDSKI